MISRRAYDAIVLDVDGTLLTDEGAIRPRTLEALRAAHGRGVRVMLATGRSEMAAFPVVARLGFDTPAVVYNGAGLLCAVEGRLLEHRLLEGETVRRVLDFAGREELLTVVSRSGEKLSSPPRDGDERRAVELLEGISVIPREALPVDSVLRVSVFSARHGEAVSLASSVEAVLGAPAYLTWFPLRVLAAQRTNGLHVVDVHPPCGGKREALRVLEERYGIPRRRVVAVGDAQNDVELLAESGLGVAMANAMDEALAAADRVIGDNNGDALAELVEELF